MNLAGEIRSFFEGDVETSPKVRDEYSRDASLFRIKPEIVVFPKGVADVCNLVSFVAKKKQGGASISLTARSGGTDMTGGPLSQSIVLVFARYMNRLKGFAGEYAVVEPGMYYRDFDAETKKHGLILPSYPASREICAIGGMVANNAGGEKNLKYGKTERYVKKITMVLGDGKPHVFKPLHKEEWKRKMQEDGIEGDIYRRMRELIISHRAIIEKARPAVSKNSSGYNLWDVFDENRGVFDLTKVIVGSQGTLGIITDVTFQLVRPNPHSALLVLFLDDMNNLGRVIKRIMRHKPESFESYDDHTFRVAIQFFPEFAARLKSTFFKLAVSFLPEMWMVLTGGVPKLVLLVEFTAKTEKEARLMAEKAEKDIHMVSGLRSKIARTNAEAEKYWVMRRESFNLLRRRVRGLRAAPFIDDVVVPPEQVSEFLPKLKQIIDEYDDLIYTIAGHMGDGNFHVIPLMDPKNKRMKQTIREVARRVYDLVFAYHGSISGEHNDGLIRGAYVEDMFGKDMYGLFQQTKRIFDPNGIFNPGKKLDVSLENMLGYIETKS
ncbi:MAG: hypothetical protein A3J55_00565 [Candidatus Ryanbacteria bacterium RIFCSPHIGHO2_02_FULL_45_17b]|uniref:D-lactate dehydrogenase (cytochrome) n=1 Tax=Candidatus Ryanbacteria bacterium RIFCSPHIGHO2_01_FULL_45_22 TaxID=1802114 RepID=A0A1G2G1X2_9BACT|nr:MAG: hypothetical protein A2719_03030 [Candidatus Ryanbacteria bacterium RIFCSPHIGHO2_01_FULL_45_22]OGZ47035.1 MAG: hypothetical protein A3J55_00565 [Candidatus Ryanbacteria bacterium RIFCSPHIGHO2_02_FULL_45_17b]